MRIGRCFHGVRLFFCNIMAFVRDLEMLLVFEFAREIVSELHPNIDMVFGELEGDSNGARWTNFVESVATQTPRAPPTESAR